MTPRNLQIVFRGLRLLWRYRLRSTLLTLSAALGVGGVVCSVNYGTGGSKQILDQIRRMGTNVLIITPAESRVIAGRARTGGAVTTLVERDYSAIRKELLTRTRSSAIVTDSLRIKAGDLSKTTAVLRMRARLLHRLKIGSSSPARLSIQRRSEVARGSQ